MNKLDDLERLASLTAGELPEDEARRLQQELQERPDLREGLGQLELLEQASAHLSVELDAKTADRLVKAALGPSPARAKLPLWIGAAALASAVAAAVALSPPKPAAPGATMTVSGAVAVNEVPVPLSAAPRTLVPGDAVETGANGMAVLSVPRGTVRLPPRSRLRMVSHDALALDRGTLLVSAQDLSVSGLGTTAAIRGDAVLSVEPPEGADRVTDAVASSGGEMTKLPWLSLVPPAASALAADGMTVFVLAGSAQTSNLLRGAMTVRGGERWQAGETQPVAVAGAAPRAARRAAAVTALHEEIAQLRAQRDALVKQRDALLAERAVAQSAADEQDPNNKYRPSQAELLRRAERGVLMFTTWMGFARAEKLPNDLVQQLHLSASEEKQVLEASRAGERRLMERLRALYVGLGGDPQVSKGLRSFYDFAKATERLSSNEPDRGAPGRVAEELAGVRPKVAASLGSLDVRIFRTMAEEQEALFDALDQILGPQRAASLVNSPELFTIQVAVQGEQS